MAEEENPFAEVKAENLAEVKQAVALFEEEFNKKNKEGKWHCSNVMDHTKEGDVWTLQMTVCSGDLCQMVNGVTVDIKSKAVMLPAKKKGFF